MATAALPLNGASRYLEWGVASAPHHGETDTGDACLVRPCAEGALIAVIDGLGHGPDAAAAAQQAVAVLSERDASVIALVQRCHDALAGTRGVVMSLAVFAAARDTLSWIGVGNVTGILVRADPTIIPAREQVLARGGVVGLQLPQLRASLTTIAPGDLVVFATDGIRQGFAAHALRGKTPQEIADRVLAEHGSDTDDALVLAARYRAS